MLRELRRSAWQSLESRFMDAWSRLPARSDRCAPVHGAGRSTRATRPVDKWSSASPILQKHGIESLGVSSWTRPLRAPSPLEGTWYLCDQATSIAQRGDRLVLTNELGNVAHGRLLDGTHIVAEEWHGLRGIVVAGAIHWSNNITWNRVRQEPPDLQGTWSHADRVTRIQQRGNLLTFTNEHGDTSRGRYLDRTQVLAVDWSDLRGTIVNGTAIHWSNSSIWLRRT